MNTKLQKIVLGVIVLIAVVAGIVYYAMRSKEQRAPEQAPYVPPVVEKVNTSISDKVGKTNPFDVKVNPYEGYKNPFAQ